MAQQQSRTAGHGYTFLRWRGDLIANVQQIAHVSPQPVSQPAVIHPINFIRPLEIAAPAAIGHGVLTLQIIELWNEPIWNKLAGIAGSGDLADIFNTQNALADEIIVQQVVVSPDRGTKKVTHYHGCKVADMRNGETIDVTTIQVNKEFDIWYAVAIRDDKPLQYAKDQPGLGRSGA